MRVHDWAFFVAIGAFVLAIVSVLRGEFLWVGVGLLASVGSGVFARVSSRRHPGPMPHSIRWMLHVPRGPHSPARLKRVLEARSGECILEIGPGIGIHALSVASALAPSGVLHAMDLQPAMLANMMKRAKAAGVENLTAIAGDATRLPFPGDSFDAVYLLTVLGEVPDATAALGELRRVLRPTGRLVIGELSIDPDFIRLRVLRERARAAGFALHRVQGSSIAYLALFHPVAA